VRLFHFIQVPVYTKIVDGFKEKELQRAVEEEIIKNPDGGSPLKGGIQKIRVHSTERPEGKSGGYRIWFFVDEPDHVYLFYALDKHDAENLTKAQEKVLETMVLEAKAEMKKEGKKHGR